MTRDCPIDWEALDEHFVGDAPLIAVIGSMFLDSTDSLIRRLECAMASGESLAIRLAAHTVKGSLTQIFAKDAQILVESIEKRAIEGEVEELEEDVTKLVHHIEAIKAALEEYAESHPPAQ
jgi:HPt (histidine-containing phosphotransfer) domain-containing protein